MTTLVIVESPGKVKKISALLGAGYKVVASVGHVRDLPPKELGIEPPDFRPHYQPTERGRDVLARLKKDVAAADRICWRPTPTVKARQSRGTWPTRSSCAIRSASPLRPSRKIRFKPPSPRRVAST